MTRCKDCGASIALNEFHHCVTSAVRGPDAVRLLALHDDVVTKAEALALDHERTPGKKRPEIIEAYEAAEATFRAALSAPPQPARAENEVNLWRAAEEVRTNGRWSDGEQRGQWVISRAVYDTLADAVRATTKENDNG